MTNVDVCVEEWQQIGPTDPGGDGVRLRGVHIEEGPARMLAQRLAAARVLEVLELRDGLSIRAFSYVGRVRIGSLTVTVVPKIGRAELLSLFRYAYGLRDLRLLGPTQFDTVGELFQDLLVAQLHAEVRELLDRGLARRYVHRTEDLQSPRGRIDMIRLACGTTMTSPELPCRHHPRSSDHLINQVLLAGLRLARNLVQDAHLGVAVSRLATQLEQFTCQAALSASVLDRALRSVNRLVAAYEPALKVVELLYHGSALSLGEGPDRIPVPGFLLDMNRFFQALMGRFLVDFLDGYDVSHEHRLRDMMRYLPGQNPLRRRPPQPRPDFAIMRKRAVVALLDAKYRDLWERDLPRHMLYQLATYALSQPGAATAAMLYPTTAAAAREAVIEIRHPVDGAALGRVAMRPVPLGELAAIVGDPSRQETARCLARRLALGREEPPVRWQEEGLQLNSGMH